MYKKAAIAVLLIACGGLGLAWLLGWFAEDPALAEIRQMQAQLADPNLTDAQRFAGFQALQTRMEGLSESSRRAVWESGARMFQRQMEARMDHVLSLPPAERAKALDEDIDRMERMRAAFAGAAGARPAGPPPGFRGFGNLSDAELINFTRGGLDRSTPAMRSKMNQYFRLIAQRRHQRGLPPWGRS